MKKEAFTYLSSNKINTINAIKWIPNENPVCIVQLTHGMAEYIERYDEFAKFFELA